jgi:hypothetical protein
MVHRRVVIEVGCVEQDLQLFLFISTGQQLLHVHPRTTGRGQAVFSGERSDLREALGGDHDLPSGFTLRGHETMLANGQLALDVHRDGLAIGSEGRDIDITEDSHLRQQGSDAVPLLDGAFVQEIWGS